MRLTSGPPVKTAPCHPPFNPPKSWDGKFTVCTTCKNRVPMTEKAPGIFEVDLAAYKILQ
jgi:hypothetical protein